MHMTRSNRVVSTTAAAVLAMVTLSAAPAFADGSSGHSSSGHSVLRASLMGSTPAPVSPMIAGINPGGNAWVNGPSNVRVRRDGRISVTIRRLVIPPPDGTGVNPVLSAVATLVCGNMVRVLHGSVRPEPCRQRLHLRQDLGASPLRRSHRPDPARREPQIYIASAMGEDD